MSSILYVVLVIIIAIGAAFIYLDREPGATPLPLETPKETGQNNPPSATKDTPAAVPALSTLNYSNRGLTALPREVLDMMHIQSLDISNNRLTGALPAEIRHLQNLEILDVSNNLMTGLPAELGQLSKLRVLNVSNNQLTGIPHELGNLQNLEILDLSGNAISEYDLKIIREKLPVSAKVIL